MKALHETSRRLPELDALRGLMLVGMTLTHLPTRASYYSYQPLGFVAWAEGFILVSAILAGKIYGRMLDNGSFATVTRRLWQRAGKLYGYHLVLLAVAFTVVAALAVSAHNPALFGMVDFYLAHPASAILAGIALVYCPALLDILPMYIAFLLVTSLCLCVGRRWGWHYVLLASAGVWLAAQFGIREVAYAALMHVSPVQVPYQNLGAFNLFAWQFLWIVGLWIGSGAAHGVAERCKSGWIITLAALIVVAFLVMRYQLLGIFVAHPVDQGRPWILFDKWHLGLLRLVNVAALAALFAAFRQHMGRYFALPPLILLGRASLDVFFAHILVCYAAIALVGDGSNASGARQWIIIVGCFAILYALAHTMKKRKGKSTTAYNWPQAQPAD